MDFLSCIVSADGKKWNTNESFSYVAMFGFFKGTKIIEAGVIQSETQSKSEYFEFQQQCIEKRA
jgi:hypothetical protein